MSKVNVRPGRQAQEIGAAIVETWFKLLPTAATILRVDTSAGGDLAVTINRRLFSDGDAIFLRTEDGATTTDKLTVRSATPQDYHQNLVLVGAPSTPPAPSVFLNGWAIPETTTDPRTLGPELEAVLGEIVDVGANVRVIAEFDTLTEIHIVVPRIPDGILTRSDLIKYLGRYHEYGQGRHYHDELGMAVLFGCR